MEAVEGVVEVGARGLDFGEVAVRVALDAGFGISALLVGLFEGVGACFMGGGVGVGGHCGVAHGGGGGCSAVTRKQQWRGQSQRVFEVTCDFAIKPCDAACGAGDFDYGRQIEGLNPERLV